MADNLAQVLSPQDVVPCEDSRVADFFELLKPRVMSLVVFCGFAGAWMAPGFGQSSPALMAIAMLCLAINAGAAGAINMWYDRDIDALMHRTRGRPIPSGRILPEEALTFGLVLSLFSVMIMGLALNWVAAGLMAFASFFYVVVYTMWLKRRTPQNIVIGGAAGAFPPMIGWASVTGDISVESLLLFAIIFFWTPPHFWALSLFSNEDYKRANIPMMPVVRGERATKIQMLVYLFILFPVALAPAFIGMTGWLYGVCAFLLNGFFVYAAFAVWYSRGKKMARLMFGYSIFYLFSLFLAMMLNAA